MNQTAQYACIGCTQADKAPRGTAKRVPVDRHKKFNGSSLDGGGLASVRKRQKKGGQGKGSPSEKNPIESRGMLSVCTLDGVTNDPPPIKTKVIPLWDRPHPCHGCKTIIKGHHWCKPCIRARKSDNPEKALAEVRRKRKAGEIKKGWPKGRLRHQVSFMGGPAHRQTLEGV
jgi:hypothetical protein